MTNAASTAIPNLEVAVTTAAIDDLADWIFDEHRTRPILVISSLSTTQRPAVDVPAFAKAVEPWNTAVYVISPRSAFDLTERVGIGLQVYGGALRIYLPDSDFRSDQCPVFTVAPVGPPESVVLSSITAFLRHRCSPAQAAWTTTTGDEAAPPADEYEVYRAKIRDLEARNIENSKTIASLRKSLRSTTDQLESAREQVHIPIRFSDPMRQLAHEVELRWLDTTDETDRVIYPLRELHVVDGFVDTLGLEGVSRERIVHTVTEVACGRARDSASLQPHVMRERDAGDSPARTRPDGGVVWRCALQRSTPSGRQLIWWECPDGSLELAKIALHDDLSVVPY